MTVSAFQTPPIPSDIKLHRLSRQLELVYESGENFSLPCEYLRVYTPSAEARGHAPGQEKLQHGCIDVNIDAIEAVGNYALRLSFSDGHDTGLYTWELLYNLGKHQAELWSEYLLALAQQGLSREASPANTAASNKRKPCHG